MCKILTSARIAMVFLFVMASCSGVKTAEKTSAITAEIPALIPLPTEVNWSDEVYQLPKKNTICAAPGTETAAKWLEKLLISASLDPKMLTDESCGNWQLKLNKDLISSIGEEGYALTVNDSGILLESGSEAGLFYGIQTLRQFFPAQIETGKTGKIAFRQVQIQDTPAYEWRGSMVDMARSFFGMDYLKTHIDRMALYKMNRLHLHLSDDQGWRIQLDAYPQLTEIGSKSSVEGGRSGFLTKEEFREIQEYARERHIIVIPEIDMPGHIYAALRSLPELNCEDQSNINPAHVLPPEPYTGYKVGWTKFCMDNPKTYEFAQNVLREIAEMTMGDYLHIGGDEIEDPAYEEFILKIDKMVQDLGKTGIGWEEITKAAVSNNMISQQWHGKVNPKNKNIRQIESICSSFYLDHANVPGQPNTLNWCNKDGVSLADVYGFRSENPNALGMEAPVWSEHVLTDEMMDDRFWPRLMAVAEISWTPEHALDFEDFKQRLGRQGLRMKLMGIHHYPTPGIAWPEVPVNSVYNDIFSGFSPNN
ncbi:MAG: beta-N-acetylhexosaminidase [Christiangramia sp.]|uniref:beta-N-acetylhexosaminidase n=1 Tax=Christiangramia sp. TaxID=1931228 RepID=UPI003241C3A1